jgi:hypothetical protein
MDVKLSQSSTASNRPLLLPLKASPTALHRKFAGELSGDDIYLRGLQQAMMRTRVCSATGSIMVVNERSAHSRCLLQWVALAKYLPLLEKRAPATWLQQQHCLAADEEAHPDEADQIHVDVVAAGR